MTPDDPCWVCGEVDVEPVPGGTAVGDLSPDDLRITDARYGLTLPLVRCRACGFVFARRSSLPALVELYSRLDDAEYGASAEGRRRQMARLLRWAIRGLPRPGRLLDVGAAGGFMLEEAEALGLDAVGVEPSRPLAERARRQGLVVHEGVLPHPALADAAFDMVTLVDVIEHVDDPLDLLAQCRRCLGEGGRLVVVTPDRSSVAARLLGRRWWHRRLAHVGYFDRSDLTLALERSGFVAERWGRPRWYLPVGYLLARVQRYVPGRGRSEPSGADGSARTGGFLLPLDLRDSWAVVARAS